MRVSRRGFVGGAAALGVVSTLPWAGRAEDPLSTDRLLTASPAKARLAKPDDPLTDVWGYNDTVPGPILRLKRGEPVSIFFDNGLPQASSVHWHGLRIDNAMDGVVGLTQSAVAPGERFHYRFTPPDAGTFWYHPHNRSWEQLARGLYGALIVEDDGALAVDRDLPVLVDDWRLTAEAQIHVDSLGAMSDRSHAGRLGNWLTLNGRDRLDLAVRSGERIRLRLINVATDRVMAFDFPGHAPQVIALDGMAVAPHAPAGGAVTLAPGQRADVVIDCDLQPGSETEIREVSTRSAIPAGRLVYGPTARRPAPPQGSIRLAAPGLPEPRLGEARQFELRMAGGAMGGMRQARHQGRMMSIRELVAEGKVWAFNGAVGAVDRELFRIARGRSVVIEIVNDTAFPHAMHMHGHHFRVVSRGGQSVTPEAWRDTVLVARGERLGIAFVADNPGRWALHCHMLNHQAAGMAGHINVT